MLPHDTRCSSCERGPRSPGWERVRRRETTAPTDPIATGPRGRAPCLATAYFCLRREYRKLFLVLGVIGCIIIFFELFVLPERLGMFQFVDRLDKNHPGFGFSFLTLPLVLLWFFGPIYATAWFYRCCYRLAYPATGKRLKTRATRWLVWLGVLCLILPSMIALLVAFNRIQQSPTAATVSPEPLVDSLRWITGSTVIGILLMFLGLVHRKPIFESRELTSPPTTT